MNPTADPIQGPASTYEPMLQTEEVGITCCREFEYFHQRYNQAITHLQGLSKMDVDEHFKARQREVAVTIDEAVTIMKGLVDFLRYVTKGGGIPELDGWSSAKTESLGEQCDRGIRVMTDGIDRLAEQWSLCGELSALSIG